MIWPNFGSNLRTSVAVRSFAIGGAASFFVWGTLLTSGVSAPQHCNVGVTSCNAKTIRREHPYCDIDPTCTSLTRDPDRFSTDQQWQGLAIEPADTELITTNALTELSIVNWIAFTGLSGSVFLLSVIAYRRSVGSWASVSMVFCVSTVALYLFELLRWLFESLEFSRATSGPPLATDPLTYLRARRDISYAFDAGIRV